MDKLTTALGYTPKTIAIFRAIKLGDLLCAIPAFRALRTAFPKAHIALISLPWATEFVASYPQYLDEFIDFPGWPGLPEQPVDAIRTVNFLRQMQARQWDVVLQMQGNGSLVNAMLSLVDAKALAGFYPADVLSEKWIAHTDLFQPYPVISHEVHRHLGLMAFLGITPQGDTLEFTPDDTAKKQARTLLTEIQVAPGRYVCLHPGGISGRRWPANRFAEVGDALAGKGYTIILTGTTAERPIHDDVRRQMRYPACSLAGQTNLSTLGAVLHFAALLVSNDTGIAHLATACHTSSVILFTSASPAEWGPLDTVRHRIVREEDAQGANRVITEAIDLLALSSRQYV